MPNAPLLAASAGHVLTLTLNRPEQRNAIDTEAYLALSAALDRAESDPDIRVVALRAEGRHFSAGVDLAKLKTLLAAPEQESRDNARLAASVLHRLAILPLPTVAAVQGGAHGGGVGLILACDVAIAASNAKFSMAEVRLGLFPGLVAPLLAAAVGRRAAGRYLLTGDPFDAETALGLGVVHEVVAPDALETALARYAERLASSAPAAVCTTKQLLWDDRFRLSDDWDIDWIADEVVRHRASPQAAEGVDAFLEKRTPTWSAAES